MKKAIEKLKQLANDNSNLADSISKNEVVLWNGAEQVPQDRKDNLISSYKYWSQCLFISAWLLENEEKQK